MSEIRITKESVEAVQQKLIQYLTNAGYEGTLEDGTGIYDLLIKGNALITMYLHDQVDKTRAYLSLAEAQKLKDVLGSEYDEVVDSILSNFFVSRREGSSARLVIRIWFSRVSDFIKISQNARIATIKGEAFYPITDYVLQPSDFNSQILPDQLVEQYYTDLEVYTNSLKKLDIALDTRVNADVSNVYYLRSEITNIISLGEDKENSSRFIERTQEVLTTRELITYRAISTVLQDTFPDIHKLYIAGYGSPEQCRDIKEFEGITVHVGNKADIYINGNQNYFIETFDVPEDHKILIEDKALSYVFQVTDPESQEAVNFTYSFTGDDYMYGTINNPCQIEIDSSFSGEKVQIEFLYSNVIKGVHDYLYNNYQRVVCYHPVVKFLYPVILNLSMNIVWNEDPIDHSLVKEEASVFVRNIPVTTPYIQSRLVEHLHKEFPEINRIILPIEGTFTFIDPDSLEEISGGLGDILSSDMIGSTSQQVTANTIEFYTHTSLVNITDA